MARAALRLEQPHLQELVARVRRLEQRRGRGRALDHARLVRVGFEQFLVLAEGHGIHLQL